MGDSTIEWTDKTWGPVRGCRPITPGCDNCYAERMCNNPYFKLGGFEPRPIEGVLSQPLRWTTQKMVFVCSMADLFEKSISDDYIRKVWRVMAQADWHVYQVLTKRASRMRQLVDVLQHYQPGHSDVEYDIIGAPPRTVLSHIWCGVSVENRKHGLPRIEHLRRTPAAVRFLSVEPLLEDLGEIDLTGIDWVIVGGESGPGARPMESWWVESIHHQCIAANVPFFFKQWGGVQKKKAGRDLGGYTWDDMPPIVRAPYPGRAAAKARREALGL